MTLEWTKGDGSPAAGTFGPRDLLGLDRVQNSPTREVYRDMERDAQISAIRGSFGRFLADLEAGMEARHAVMSSHLACPDMRSYIHTMWTTLLWVEGEIGSAREAIDRGESPSVGVIPHDPA